tara:strand:+ start:2818 stop:3663 length:846 start_codon:yes stop_codon:yes gene_type:complete
MQSANKYNPILDLFFFIFLLLFIILLDQYFSKILNFIFTTNNKSIIRILLFSMIIILFYKISIFSAHKINIPKFSVYILIPIVIFIGIIKFFLQSNIMNIILEVLLVDVGAIFIIFQIVKRYDFNVKNWLGINLISINKIKYFGIYFLAWPIIILWSQLIEYLNLEIFKSNNYSKEIFDSLNNNYFLIFFLACIVAPFCEEVIFRGYLYKIVKEKSNIATGVIINSIIFGVIHLEPSSIVPAAILGIALSIIRIKTKSLLPSITIHTFHNLLALIVTSQTL